VGVTEPEAGAMSAIKCHINDEPWSGDVPDHMLLSDFVRERLHLTGTKVSCGVEVCGACTVLLDGAAISSCTTLAAELDGRRLLTVEGLDHGGELHPVQAAFVELGAVQCGFCTPGMVLTVCALQEDHPDADLSQIRQYLSSTICRCTGYAKIVAAAAKVLSDARRE
jgi:carbon-monoxide dehydrogenase small subunit